MNHADIQKALLAAAVKRGYNDFNKGIHINPYHAKSQAALHRKWDEGHGVARNEHTFDIPEGERGVAA
jgi:hypothetical protein